MKKRLTCLFLCLLMVLSVFLAGCAEETEEDVQDKIEEMAAKNTVSLTMWVVSEEKVSDTVAAAVTKELSTLTEAKYKARLEIKYFTKDEYYENLTSSVAAYLKDSKNKVQTTEEETQDVPQTEEGADGLLRDKYPDFEKNQVDIIYIGDVKEKSGEAFFNEFVSKGYLAKLDECIDTNAKTLREYLSPTLLSAVQKNGVTYAIPNNNVIGEYTYMLMNKELMDVIFSGYVLDGSIDALYNDHVYGFLDQIKTMTDSSVLPIDATYEECLELLAHYWSIDSKTYDINGTDFSVFGSLYEDLSELSRGSVSLDVESLFANPEFVKSYLKLNSYRLNEEGRDFFRSEKNEKTVYDKTAIKFLKGDLTILTEVVDENTKESVYYYDDTDGTRYYAVPVKYPSATSDDIYSNMFGVFANAKDVSRCMDIITCINTNEKARNILQYGILDEHYSLKEREVEGLAESERSYYVEPKSDGGKLLYNMDLYATGNAFLAYMPAEMNESVWERGKEQNRSSLVDPLLGFDLDEFASSAASIGNDLTLPSVAYKEELSCSFTYVSGYSKEVLSQNATLKDWIKSCDEKSKTEKGIFVYKTFTENKSSQKMNAVFYVYNTLGAAKATVDPTTGASIPAFEVVATPKKTPVMNGETQKIGEDGKPVFNETGMDLCFKYGALSDGYTLSVVEYVGTSNATYENTLSALVGKEEKAVSLKDANYVVSIDPNHTNYYDVNVYGDLYVEHFKSNDYIFNTVSDWINNDGSTHRILRWKETAGQKDKYTFLIYLGDVATATKLNINVFGDEKTPVLDLYYVAEGYAKDEKDGRVKPIADFKEMIVNGDMNSTDYKSSAPYILYYVTAEVAKGVEISINSTHETLGSMRNGKAGKIEELAFDLTDMKDLSTKMDVFGELDTELVAYMEELNASLVAILNACTTYDELCSVVSDFSVLLDPAKAATVADLKNEAVIALFADDDALKALNEKIVHITSRENPAGSDKDDAPEGDTEEGGSEEDKAPAATGADSIYYYSPYGIYYQWMKEYSYLPK